METAEMSYWEDFEHSVTLDHNPLFPRTQNIRSNISGGYGYWAGYASWYGDIIIEE